MKCGDDEMAETDKVDEKLHNETDRQGKNNCLEDDLLKLNKEKTERDYDSDDNIANAIDQDRNKGPVESEYNHFLSEEFMEDEEDVDTQVPNIPVDTFLRGKVRMRGGFTTPGNLYLISTSICNLILK